MTPLGWILIGAGAFCALLLFVGMLCAVAKDADEALDQRDRDQGVVYDWSNVAHLDCERRRRRGDTRNGLGGAA